MSDAVLAVASEQSTAPILQKLVHAARELVGATYAALGIPDEEEGFAEFLESDEEWRSAPDNLALVAEVDGEVAGYLEASIQPPLESAQWQGQRDLAATRLYINYVGTRDAFKRRGVATRLVEEAEAWGRSKGATVALCDTYIDSPMSVPFWEERMGYKRRSIRLRKPLTVTPEVAEQQDR